MPKFPSACKGKDMSEGPLLGRRRDHDDPLASRPLRWPPKAMGELSRLLKSASACRGSGLKSWPPYADYAKKTEREIPVVVLDPVG
jgi:F420H(2)-dependent quinone reductase